MIVTMQVYVGCSGYSYDEWYGVFYPKSISRQKMLEYYSLYFPVVEINATFYTMPTEWMVKKWSATKMKYIIKYNREITHEKKLRGIEETLSLFHSRLIPLIKKQYLVAFLVQLPPSLERNLNLLENFLKLIPFPEMHAIEFRHSSWFVPDTIKLLRKYGSAFVIVDCPTLPRVVWTSTKWGYVRLHGRSIKPDWYHYCYTREQLEEWASRIESLRNDIDRLYVLFNNHPRGNATRNAMEFVSILSSRGINVIRQKKGLDMYSK